MSFPAAASTCGARPKRACSRLRCCPSYLLARSAVKSCGNRFYGLAFRRRVSSPSDAIPMSELPQDYEVLIYGRKEDEEPFHEETNVRVLSARAGLITLATSVGAWPTPDRDKSRHSGRSPMPRSVRWGANARSEYDWEFNSAALAGNSGRFTTPETEDPTLPPRQHAGNNNWLRLLLTSTSHRPFPYQRSRFSTSALRC